MSEEQKKESTDLVKKDKPAPIQTSGGRGLNLTCIEDMYRFGQYVVSAGLAPKGMEKVESVVIALEMGAEVGLAPMQSIQNICVVNGRATIWGDAVPALVHNSGKQEWYTQKKIGTIGTDSYGYEVVSKRKGNPEPIATTFTVAEAKKANLWGKAGPWVQYPDRMLLNRARAFNARDNFPDVLKGMYTTEEIQDVEFQVVDSKPLEDGEKTSRLADRLAEKITPEVHDNIEDVTVQSGVTDVMRGVNSETTTATEAMHSKRGRPAKQEATDSKKETVEVQNVEKFDVYSHEGPSGYIAMLKAEMSNRKSEELIAARKALEIRKLNIADFTPDESKAVLLWLEKHAEKGE